MAIGISLLAHNGNNSNTANRTASEITIAEGDALLFAAFGRENSSGDPGPSLSVSMINFGGDWNWNYSRAVQTSGNRHGLMLATAIAPVGLTDLTAIPVLPASESCNRWGWAFAKLTGITNLTHLKTGTVISASNTLTPTLSSAASANGIAIAACCSVGDTDGDTDGIEAGWNLLSDSNNYSTTTLSWLGLAYRIGGGDDGCAFNNLNTTGNLAIAIELEAAAATRRRTLVSNLIGG